jgi:hypothetical protein
LPARASSPSGGQRFTELLELLDVLGAAHIEVGERVLQILDQIDRGPQLGVLDAPTKKLVAAVHFVLLHATKL